MQLARTSVDLTDLTLDVQLARTSEFGSSDTISSSGGRKSSTPIRSAEVLVVAVVMIFGSEGSELVITKEFVDLSASARPSESKFVSDH